MKTTFSIIMLVLLPLCAVAQIDSATVASRYVGAFYIGSYDANGILKNDITFRVGGDAVLPAYERVTLNARAGYEIGQSGKGTVFGKFYLERKSSFLDVAMGLLPRPITLVFRATPLSPGGHFEPPALAAMPGGNIGAYLAKQIGKDGPSVMAGSYYLAASRSIEWDASVKQKIGSIEMRAAGFMGRIRKGVGASIHVGGSSFTAFTTSDSISTTLLSVRTGIVDPYLNVNYNRARRDYDHLEFGWTKIYCLPYGGQILIGMGYQYHSKFLNTYVQLYL